MRRRWLSVGLVAAALLILAVGPAPATTSLATQPFDARLTSDPHYAEGEPSVAVNPTNPANIIVTFLSDTFFGFPSAYNGQPPTDRAAKQNIQGCDYVVTFDKGKSWARHTLPIANFEIDPTRPNCSDTIVLFDRTGTAYIMGASFQFPLFVAGMGDFRLIRSTNGGKTWSKPTVISPTVFSPGSDPASWQGVRFYDDRPFMAIDDSTTPPTIYVNGTQGRADAKATAGDIEYLTASTNGGKTWSNAVAVGLASASPLAAAFGIVAFTNPPPMGASRACSCVDLVVSTNAAHSYVRRPTPIPSGSGLFGAATAADPTRRGEFAVLTTDAAGNALVYRTPDAGKTWAGPTRFGVPGTKIDKPWIAYSPTGVVGVGWRAISPDNSYAYYATVSSDAGATFAAPTRISRSVSPAPAPYMVAGDDTTSVTLTADHLYAAWGDWRGHSGLHTWWGGFALNSDHLSPK
jgi:hypothetical protein